MNYECNATLFLWKRIIIYDLFRNFVAQNVKIGDYEINNAIFSRADGTLFDDRDGYGSGAEL
jgi:hypothetical protein